MIIIIQYNTTTRLLDCSQINEGCIRTECCAGDAATCTDKGREHRPPLDTGYIFSLARMVARLSWIGNPPWKERGETPEHTHEGVRLKERSRPAGMEPSRVRRHDACE